MAGTIDPTWLILDLDSRATPRRQMGRRERVDMADDYDLVVLGTGSAFTVDTS